MSTIDALRAILQKDLDLAPESVQVDTKLEDLDIDSLTMVEILFRVEDEFAIKVPSDQAAAKAKPQTVAELVEYIDRLVAEQRGTAGGGQGQ